MTPDSKKLLEEFVDHSFVRALKAHGLEAQDRVQWFKNWTGLQSIRGLEHFHVLIRDAPQTLIDVWTQGK